MNGLTTQIKWLAENFLLTISFKLNYEKAIQLKKSILTTKSWSVAINDGGCPGQKEILWITTWLRRELFLFAESVGAGKMRSFQDFLRWYNNKHVDPT